MHHPAPNKPYTIDKECHYSSDYMFLFIGLHGINGTLTAFLGLRTDFKRKLDLTVVAIPPKAGTLRRQPNGRKAKSV